MASRLTIALTLATVPACLTEPTTGEVGAALTAAYPDVDSPDANIVVRVDDATGRPCTGTLISANRVLTAKHCITGSTDAVGNMPAAIFPLTVYFGADNMAWQAPSIQVSSRDQVVVYGAPFDRINSSEAGIDLAIL